MRALLLICLSTSIAHADVVTCKEAAPTTQLTATFKPDVSLRDLVIWVAGFSCKNIVVAPDVEQQMSKLSIVAPKPMSPKQALELFITAVEASGLVVQQKPGTIVIKLDPKVPRCPKTTSVIPVGGELAGDPFKQPTPPEPDFQKLIDNGIKKVSDTQYEISKALVDAVLANPMAALKGARVVPSIKDGKTMGFKLYAIRPNSPYAMLGLTNGDTLTAINGIALTDAETALEAYTKLRSATKLTVSLIRRDKPVTLTWVIK